MVQAARGEDFQQTRQGSLQRSKELEKVHPAGQGEGGTLGTTPLFFTSPLKTTGYMSPVSQPHQTVLIAERLVCMGRDGGAQGSEVKFTQSCPILCDSTDTVHRIL